MSAPKTIRVFIADDSAALREHVIELIEDVPRVSIVGFAGEEVEVVASIRRLKPDVVLLDIQLSRGNGLEILRNIKPKGRGPLTIVATNFPHPQYRKRALDLGADYFLDKTTDIEALRGLIARLTATLQSAGMN